MHTHNEIDYIEFTSNDIPETKRFYAGAFGWEFTDYSPTYIGIKGEGREMGGFSENQKTAGACTTLAVIYSNDLEVSVGKVQKFGGSVSKEIFSFPGGRRFHFVDPSGNELAVWSDK